VKAPPAFQFYPDVFEQGTANMTLAEVGGYMRLLNAQWAQGSIPGDDAKRLAVIMRCTPAAAQRVWLVVRDKFVRGPDGGWRNARMEYERTKQARFREAQSDRGKLGGRPKAGAFVRLKPDESGRLEKPEQSPPSPSPKEQISVSIETPPPIRILSGGGGGALIVSPLQFAKQAEKFAWYGSRLRVPHVLHDELRTKLGGPDPHTTLLAWYVTVNDDAEAHGTPIVDVFVFLRPKFVEWASDAAADAELEKFRPKEAAWTGTPGNGSTSGSARPTARPSTANNAPRTTKV